MSPIISNKKYTLIFITKESVDESFGLLKEILDEGLNALVIIFNTEELDEVEKKVRLNFWKYLGENKIEIYRLPIVEDVIHTVSSGIKIQMINTKSEDKIF